MIKFTGAIELFCWAPASSSVAMTWTSSRGDSGDNSDWIREQFLDLYNLNATQLVSVRI